MSEAVVVKSLVWDVNRFGDPPVISFHQGKKVIPSGVGEAAPDSCRKRTKEPRPGQYEVCRLVLSSEGGISYKAFPLHDSPDLDMLGYSSAYQIGWVRNEIKGGVVVRLEPEGAGRHFNVFPGDNRTFGKIARPGSVPWRRDPEPGETWSCLISWFVSDRDVCGYAFPTGKIEVEEHRGVIHLYDGEVQIGLFIPCEKGWEATASRDQDEIVVRLRPTRDNS